MNIVEVCKQLKEVKDTMRIELPSKGITGFHNILDFSVAMNIDRIAAALERYVDDKIESDKVMIGLLKDFSNSLSNIDERAEIQ